MKTTTYNKLVRDKIPTIIEKSGKLSARENVAKTVNKELMTAYWNIGKIIVENEQLGSAKAEYGKQLLKSLSKELTRELGKGFSRSNLREYGGICKKCGSDKLYFKEIPNEDFAERVVCKVCGFEYELE